MNNHQKGLIFLLFIAVILLLGGCTYLAEEKIIRIGEPFRTDGSCEITVIEYENTNQLQDMKTDKNYVVITVHLKSLIRKGQNALTTLKTLDCLTNTSTEQSVNSVYLVDENGDLIHSNAVREFDNIIELELREDTTQCYKIVFETDEAVSKGNFALSILGEDSLTIPLQ